MIDDQTLSVFDEMLRSSLETPHGREAIADARIYLWDLVETNRFNSERAKEVFTIAIDKLMWSCLKGTPISVQMYQDYKASCLGSKYAVQLTNRFTRDGLIKDQRPVRKHFRW